MAVRGFIRPVDTIAVELGRNCGREIGVENLIGFFGHFVALGFLGRGRVVEETEFHAGRVLGKQGEIDAGAVPRGAERIRPAWQLSH